MMENSQRVFVIGAGVGGLTAAALLAREGFNVTVLEAHVYAGGCAGTFYHKGYRFDAGATVAGGFQPGGPHDLAGNLLDIAWPVQRTDPAWVVHLPDRTITRWSEPERWRCERDRVLPELRRFWAIQEKAADAVWDFASRVPEWPPSSLQALGRLLAKIPPAMLPFTPLALTTMGRLLDMLGIRDRSARVFIDAQLLISAQTTAAHANALYGAVAMDLPRVGVYHVHGGIGNLAKTLADALTTQGGTIHYRQAVTRLQILPDRTFRVQTNKGAVYEAEVVLANLTPWGLSALLQEQSPRALRRELVQRQSTWGAFTLYVGIPSPALPTHADHFQIVQRDDQPLGEGNSVFVSISDANDPTRAPQGHRALTLSTHVNIQPWWALRTNDPQAYQARVTQYRDRLLDAAERVIPGLRQNAALILPGTPAAFQRFTRRPSGMVGGFAQTSLFAARGPDTGIPNLWLVGDSVFPGQSTAGVTAGALRVAAEVQRTALR